MSFEAVPCMFRSTATDGNSSSYIGLLIRPSSSASAAQGTSSVQLPAVVGTTGNGPKSLHVVPSTVLKASHSSGQTAKVVVPSGVQLRLQPATCSATQCNDAWIQTTQTTSRSNMNSAFDSPSPSQVVPQMNVGDTYDCSMPSVTSNSFFPPISSITQNLSSAKSDIDLLQEMSPIEMNSVQSQKMPINSVDYSQHVTPPHRYQTPAQCNYSHIPMDLNTGRIPSCRYQNNYNGVSDCSATPDSGIQSIAGSPPSTDPFTPPLPSPAPYISMVSNDSELANQPTASCDDFSDMPRLIPFHQMEEAGSPVGDEAPHMLNATKTESCEELTHEVKTDVPKIAITPAMNVNELVEQLMSQMDAEQRKQFATVIQSKVETVSLGSESRETDDEGNNKRREVGTCCDEQVIESVSNVTHNKIDESNKKITEKEKVIKEKSECSELPGKIVDLTIQQAERKEGENSAKRRSKKADDTRKKKEQLVKEEVEEKLRKEEFLKREEEERLAKQIAEKVKMEQFLIEEENRIAEERRKSEGREKEKELRKQAEEKLAKERERQQNEAEALQRLREYRVWVRREINEQLNTVLEKVCKQMTDLELDLGTRLHWELPWYKLDWKEVAQRIAERNRLEKIAREKSLKLKRKLASRNGGSKRKLLDSAHPSDISVMPSSSGVSPKDLSKKETFSVIKHNVIVDVYPRVEQMSCACKSGCCGEQDKCLNRIMQMECTSSCPRNTHCKNRRIFRRECLARLKTFQTSNDCGLGVKAADPIEKGQFVCEYVGEVISKETFEERCRKLYRNFNNHYALNLCPGFVIDASRKGSIARYVNHSCSPNCEMQRWCVNGQNRIGLFALRAIAKGEQLTYDYNWDAFDFNDMTACLCGSSNCRRFINKNVLMSSKERQLAQSNRLLLLRNVDRAANRKIETSQRAKLKQVDAKKASQAKYVTALRQYADEALGLFGESEVLSQKQLKTTKRSVNATFSRSPSLSFAAIVESLEAHFSATVDAAQSRSDRKKLDALAAKLLSLRLKHADSLRQFGPLPESFEDRSTQKARKRPVAHRILPATADLSYLDSEVAVSSYDPENTSHLSVIEAESDCVRCICGITDDDGSMIQCDSCHFWLHEDCVFVVQPIAGNSEFNCEICKKQWKRRTPAVDIPLRTLPDIKLEGCTYYRTLVNSRHIQVRIYETVYMQKLFNDNHKAELKRLNEAPKGTRTAAGDEELVIASPGVVMRPEEQVFVPGSFHRKDLRCFRVERLFVSPRGHKFIFGSYYARPHEVYCEPGRMFHRKELFATTMFDTLPLDAVVGRCLVLEPRVYSLGRPKMPRYDEADVYFCEYQQTGKNSRYFEKIPTRNHYYINTEPHNFDRFPVERPLARDFTPFIMETQAGTASSRHNSSSQGHSPSGSRASSHWMPATLRDQQKVDRLETLVQTLPSKKGTKNAAVTHTSSRSNSPPQKRSRHARR